jgi:hypothetical protein
MCTMSAIMQDGTTPTITIGTWLIDIGTWRVYRAGMPASRK